MYIGKRRKMDAAEEQSCGILKYYENLKQYCRFLTQSSWDGDDLVHEVIIKAIHHYDSSQYSSALLKKIAYNHWVDTVRKQRREITGIPENLSEVTRNNIIDTVETVMTKLTPKQAVIFILKEAFRFKSSEIAEIMGTTETAVKASLHRSRKRLEKEGSLREVSPVLTEEDEKLLSDLLSESLQAEDPTVLIENIPEIPALATSTPEMTLHSRSPLSTFKMAA